MNEENPIPEQEPQEPQSETAAATAPPTTPRLTIVGIGASAGGLTALQTFFDHVPVDSDLTFVVVVHLAPGYESHLPELLQPHVRIKVQQVKETTELQPNRVYVIPPNCNIGAIDTHLRLSNLEENRASRAPIDYFFRTLARTHDGHAVGVVLTGTGSDGTLGIQEIKSKGGLVIVQDPRNAEYDGMPQSAIATGVADLILPVGEIPDAILKYSRTAPRIAVPEEGEDLLEPADRDLLEKIFALIHSRTERDFTRYKRSTIMRRIARRMQLNYIEDLSDYLDRLREHPEEVRALADDLLITVTSFFRDPDVWTKLEREIIPRLFEGKGPKDAVRVWSVGCATGEEAYTIAMLLLEESARHESRPQIQIFASDLHPKSIAKAREGFYPGDIETDVSSERLARFFQRENGGYRVRKDIRDLVIFAPHDLLADPPFSRLDLISCRNLLMYLERDVQHAVIELFHYSLNGGGILLLGPAEIVSSAALFRPEDKKCCIYRKRNVPVPATRLPVFPMTWSRAQLEGDGNIKSPLEPVPFATLHQQMVELYEPPSLLVSPDNKLVYLSEKAGRYLMHPGGEPTASVFKLVREELRIDLQALLQTARERKIIVQSKSIPVRFNGAPHPVVIHIGPALDPEQEGFALVTFEEREPAESPAADDTKPDAALAARNRELEAEIELSRQRLRSIVAESETSQEEMRAANEELQSTNEELRSTMEELETSKEELQSINEELQTVNQENRHKVDELGQLSSDLQNLLSATDIATLFLDRQMRILRFTSKVAELFNVRVTDRGRPISDLTHRLIYNELSRDAEKVLEKLAPIEREIVNEEGKWFFARILPYRSAIDRIEGVVITFMDITRRVEAETALRISETRLSEELKAMQLLHEMAGRLVVSQDMTSALEYTLDSAIEVTHAQMGDFRLLNPVTNVLEFVASRGFKPEFPDHLRAVEQDPGSASARALRSKTRVVIDDVEHEELETPYRQAAAAAGYRAVESTPLVSRDGHVIGLLSTYYKEPYALSDRDHRMLDLYVRQAADFIERCRMDDVLHRSEERYRRLIESTLEYAIFMLDLDGRIVTWNAGAVRIFGYTEKEMVGQPASRLFTEEDRTAGSLAAEMTKACAGRTSDERWYVRGDGSRFWASGAMEPLHAADGTLQGFVKFLRDNGDAKSAEAPSPE